MSDPNPTPTLAQLNPDRIWRSAPTISQLRDRGWIKPADTFSKWRQLAPNRGFHRDLGKFSQCYTITTDGVHLVVMSRETGQWFEIHNTNWIGPLSIHSVDDEDWDWETNTPKILVIKKRLPNGKIKLIFLSASGSKRQYNSMPESGRRKVANHSNPQTSAASISAINAMIDDLNF